jgi:LacI family transcriptional regulator
MISSRPICLFIPSYASYFERMLLAAVRPLQLAGFSILHVHGFHQVRDPREIVGAIGMVSNAATESLIASWPVPVVNVSSRPNRPARHSVLPDNRAAGEQAAAHLMACGFEQFGFLGGDEGFAIERRAGFAAALASRNFALASQDHGEYRGRRLDQDLRLLRRWLAACPKPLGLFCANDELSARALQTCRSLGLRVPEEIAVLGVDNDRLVCLLAPVPISSVDLNPEAIGHAAATMLLSMISGSRPAVDRILIPPTGVVARETTSVAVTSDGALNAALSYTNSHLSRRITVQDLARLAGMSERSLQKRYVARFGHGPARQILFSRIEHAKKLLSETQHTLKGVAIESGFSTFEHFCRVFRRGVGMGPTEYRQRSQSRRGE